MQKIMRNWKAHCALHPENKLSAFDQFKAGHAMRDAELAVCEKQAAQIRDALSEAILWLRPDVPQEVADLVREALANRANV